MNTSIFELLNMNIDHAPPTHMLDSLIKLPLSTWWDALYCPCSSWAHVESPDIFSKIITWLYNSTMWVWPSYHQWIIHTWISQASYDTPNLTHPPNQVGLHIWHDLKSPYITEYDNYYIIGIYITFTSNDIHDIYNKYQRSKQDHDSF